MSVKQIHKVKFPDQFNFSRLQIYPWLIETMSTEVEVEFYDLDVENDVVNEQPSKQVNADSIKDEIDGDISKDVHKTDTQGKVSRLIWFLPITNLPPNYRNTLRFRYSKWRGQRTTY